MTLHAFPRARLETHPGAPASKTQAALRAPRSRTCRSTHSSKVRPHASRSWPRPSTSRPTKTPQASSQAETSYPEATGCNQLSFNPSLYVEPTSTVAYSPSGLRLNLDDPQQMGPTIPTPSGLRKVFVILPKGMDISPVLPEGSGRLRRRRSCSRQRRTSSLSRRSAARHRRSVPGGHAQSAVGEDLPRIHRI